MACTKVQKKKHVFQGTTCTSKHPIQGIQEKKLDSFLRCSQRVREVRTTRTASRFGNSSPLLFAEWYCSYRVVRELFACFQQVQHERQDHGITWAFCHIRGIPRSATERLEQKWRPGVRLALCWGEPHFCLKLAINGSSVYVLAALTTFLWCFIESSFLSTAYFLLL